MKKSTFYDSGGNQTRKTKRWLGWLSFCLLFFVGPVGFAVLTLDSKDILTNLLTSKETVETQTTVEAVTNASFAAGADDDDEDLFACSQISPTSQNAVGYGIGGDNNQNLAGDFLVFEGTTLNIESVRVSVNSASVSTFNIILWSDNNGLPDTVLNTFNNVQPVGTPELSSGTYYLHTLDISSENLSFSSPVGDTRYWIQITGSMTGWEHRAGSSIGVADAFYQGDGDWITIGNADGNHDFVYEIIGECIGDCMPPTALTATFDNLTDVTLSWVSDGDLFDIEWGLSGFTFGTGTQINGITTNSTDITVVGETLYQFYIRQDCGADGESSWIGPYTFQTGYCIASSTNTSDVISSFVTTGGILNIDNTTGNTISPGGYGNFTNFSVAHFETGTINFTTAFSASMGFNIWVDWDDNGIFEESEKVYASGATGSSFTGSFTIPVDTELGDYRMRIRGQWNNANPLPCGNVSYGEAEDYTLTVITPPTCLPPHALTATPTSLTEVTLEWASDGDNFEVEWGLSGFTLGEGTQINDLTTNTTSVTVTIDTPYEFYVLQDCGDEDGVSLWTGPFSFQTGYCTPVYTNGCSAGAKITNFETSDAILNIANNTGTATCGTNGYDNFTEFSVAAPEDMTVSFTVGIGSWAAAVKLWVDWNGNGVFEADELMSESTATIPAETNYTDSFTVPTGTPLGDYRIRVRAVESTTTFDACSSQSYGETEDYTFTVITPPACMPPSALGVAGATFTSADLVWTSTGTLFNIEWGTSGFALGDGTSVSGVGNPYTLSGLTAETNYQYYVQQDCGTDDGVSLWAGPYQFYTGYCEPSTGTSTSYRITGFSTSEGYTNISNLDNGITSAYNNYSNLAVTQSEAGGFNYAVDVPGYTNIEIWIDYNNNMIFDTDELVAEHIYLNAATTFTGTINIPEDLDDGDYRIRVRSRYYFNTTANPCGFMTNGETEDYTLTIVPVPDCMPPTGLTATPTSLTEVTLGWTSDGSNFDIEWGPSGFTLGDGTQINDIATNSTSVTVTIDTPYQYYVRQDCGATDDGVSLWAGPINFQTGYCIPMYTNGCSNGVKISNFETSDAILNIANNTGTTTCGTDGYNNFSSLAAAAAEDMTISFIVGVGSYSGGVKIWVDWNANGVFDIDELMSESAATIATGGNYTGTFTVPSGTPLGDYRLRVRTVENTTIFDACSSQSYGETEDYTFTVITPPACMPPNELGLAGATLISADLTWTSSGDLFNVEWGASGFTPGEGTLVSGVSNPYTLSDLTAETHYQYYVQQDCGTEDGLSLWAGPYSFYTGYCEVSTTWTGDYTSAFSTIGAIQNVNYLVSAQPTGSYDNQSDQIIQQAQGLSFDFSTAYVGGGQTINIWVDWNNDMVFDDSADSTEKVYSFYATGANQSGTITIPIDIPIGDYRIRIRSQWGSGNNPPPCGNVDYGSTIDFTLNVVPAPTCFPPTQLGVAGVTFDSAVLSWTSTGDLFNIEWGLTGFTFGDGTPVNGVDNFYTLNDLAAETHYQYYVQQDCGDDDLSYWSGPYTFFTGYCEVSTGTSTSYRITGFSTTEGYTNISNLNNGITNAYNNYSNLAVTQSEAGSFNYAVDVPGYTNIEIWIDFNNNMLFDTDELIAIHDYDDIATTFTGTINIPAGLDDGDYRIRVRSRYYWQTVASPCGFMTNGETEDYTLTIVPVPDCMPPSGLTATPSSLTEVTLGWTSTGNNFDIEWGPSGFTLGDGTSINDITTNSTSVTVTIDTPYQYYVRQNCGATDDGVSLWAGPFSFQTGYCTPTYVYGCSNGAKIANFETSNGILNIFNETGSAACGEQGYNNFTQYAVAAAEGMEVTVTVDIGSYSAGVKLWVDWNGNGVFDTDELVSESTTTIASGSSYTGSFTVPSGTPLGDYRLRVRAVESTTTFDACSSQNYGETEDYTFTVITPPTCMPAIQLGANINTLTSAELYWTSVEAEDGATFEVEYGLQGFTLGTGTSVENITGTSTTVTGLTSDTWYSFYVLTDCGDDDVSLWAGPYQFYTGYCVPSATWTGYHITSFVTTGSPQGPPGDISNSSGASLSGNGYSNYSSQAAEHFETGSVDFTATISSTFNGLAIWVDWNNNMVFEESEKVYTSSGNAGTFTGIITVPLGTPLGDYRMRVRSQYDTSPASACGTINYGEAEDYTFRVIVPPTCLPAYLPTATNISASSVLLEWQSDGDLFDIEYGPAGFEQNGDTATLLIGVGNPYILSGLTAGEDYDFYVRQDCGEEDGVSTWNGPVTFTPGIYQGDIPTMLNPDPSVDDLTCAIPSFSIEVPEGHYLSELSVTYTMISTPQYMAEVAQQRSVLYSPTLEMGEAQIAVGDQTYTYPGSQNYSRDITFALGATGTIEFVLKAWRTEGGASCNTDYIFVQDGTWILDFDTEPFPTCPIPTDLGITNITETSVDLIWISEAEGLYDLEWGAIGFTPEEGEEEGAFYAIDGTTQPVTGLDSSITYEFYVRSNCSTDEEEDMSEWAGPFKFKSGYCEPISNQSRFITLFSTSGAEENITYTGATLPVGSVFGYRDHTDLIIVQQAGESFDFESNYIGGPSGARIWVDWNKNFVFEDDEEVFYHGGAALKTGTIEIPEDILPGDYVIRVYYKSGASSVPTACENVVEGEAVDFTLSIPCSEVAAPIGEPVQTFTEGQTLADLDVAGNNLTWYADEDLTEALEPTHELVHEATYYVVSSEGNCQSEALAIMVQEVVSTDRFDSASFKAYPNPVKDFFNISYSTDITDVMVINMLGQTVISKSVNATDTQIDMSLLPTGTYFVKVNIDGIIKTIKVAKQ